MTTRISTAYDAMITRIEAVLTTHARLMNPYEVARNPEQFLAKGYGLAIGPASGNRNVLSKIWVARQFNLVLTRRFSVIQGDTAAKATVEKLLMEDQMSVIQDFEANSTLNDQVTTISYTADSGIRSVFPDKDQFLVLETNFQASYLEALA